LQSVVVKAALVDPTEPPAEYVSQMEAAKGIQSTNKKDAVRAQGGLHVTSILVSAERKVAIINGEMKVEGDFVGAFQVVKIEEYRVALKNKDETQWLLLGDPILKSAIQPGDTP
jgi:hypothetical protein